MMAVPPVYNGRYPKRGEKPHCRFFLYYTRLVSSFTPPPARGEQPGDCYQAAD